MKERTISMHVKVEQISALLKKGRVSVLDYVSATLTQKATFVRSMLYIHDEGNFYVPKYIAGDIVPIKEPFIIEDGEIIYKADHMNEKKLWQPSISMKANDIRLYGKVVDVYAIRLHDMKKKDFALAGFNDKQSFVAWWNEFVRQNCRIISSREKKKKVFGFDANPMVWVYVIERNE